MGLFNWLRDSLTGPAPCMKMVPIEPDPPGPASFLPKPPPDVAAAINRKLDRDIAAGLALRRGSNPPAPGNKPEPPAGPPTNWIDPAKEKRSAELGEQLGLSPQGRSKPQPPGGRLFANGIEQPRPARWEQGFDVERLADRLSELANFVTQGPEAVRRNFTMRVPVEPYHDADLVISAAASLLRNRPAANHRSLLDLEANLRAWYKNKYGQPYFGAIPILIAIEWAQHLLQRRQDPPVPEPGEVGEVPSDELMDQWRTECRQLSADSDYAIPASSFMAQRVIAWARQQHAHLPARILAMCKKRGWSLKWADRGCYLHLESSELIESLRGKRGEPVAEAADVLLVLMSITEHAGIPWADVVKQASVTCGRLEDEGFLL